MSALEQVYAVLAADPAIVAAAAGVSPVLASQGTTDPYVVLRTEHTTVFNDLNGFAGLDYSEVSLTVTADSYTQAAAVALACRRSLEFAKILCTGQTDDLDDTDVSPGKFSCGWMFQVWVSSASMLVTEAGLEFTVTPGGLKITV